jgi:glycosyltransferase involved in cell wall biosynthesis
MNPEYVVVGGLIWKILSKPIGLWYTHKSVTWKLRIAERLSNIVFTASRESFRLLSDKLHIMGHGIDSDQFAPIIEKAPSEIFRSIAVGRISPYKDYETIIRAIASVKENTKNTIHLDIIGSPAIFSDREYLENLKKLVKENNLGTTVRFRGAISHDKLPQEFSTADLFVHTSHTGSLDKVLLEAMASGIPVISSSDVAKNLLKNPLLVVPAGDLEAFKRAILGILALSPHKRKNIGTQLRDIVVRDHNIKTLIQKIVADLTCFVSK